MDSGNNGGNTYGQPMHYGQPPQRGIGHEGFIPPGNGRNGKKKGGCGCGCLTALLIIIGVIAGIALILKFTAISSNMSFGKKYDLGSYTIGASGGVVRVDSPGSTVNGMTVTVANGSYDKDMKFKVSAAPIKSHAFGGKFNPITPLITIDNGHAFSKEPMIVDIPVNLSSDEFAMGFYYDKKKGTLEGIPLAYLGNGHIKLATDHFSDVVVSKVKRSELDKVNVDTGYRPGVDDWQFTNYGSWLAPGGHCAGQSISSMWYYYEIHKVKGERRLYGRFDNNDYGMGTIDTWKDDSWGYRFASAVQDGVDWNSSVKKISSALGSVSDGFTFDAFAYSMALTGEPQYVSIGRYYKDKNGKTKRGGHAIVAYKIADGRIYVADPNYPGVSGRSIRFSDSGFSPYSSGENAEDIAKKGSVAYTEIRYMAKSAFVDWSSIGEMYKKMLKGEAGNDKFPKYEIKLLKKYDTATGVAEWEPCPDKIKADAESTARVNPMYRGKLVFSIASGYSDQRTSLYKGLNPASQVGSSQVSGNAGGVVFTVNLDKGVNDLGFYTEFKRDGNFEYDDFKRIKVLYEQKSEIEFENDKYGTLVDQDLMLKAKVKDAPADVRYVWSFGDGSEEYETKDPKTTHVYKVEGNHRVTLRMVSNKDDTELAKAETSVDAVNLYGKWKLDYTIKKAGAIDYILNAVVKVIVSFINQIADTGKNPDDVKVSIEGTVIGCELTVKQPVSGDASDGVDVELRQLTSSTDFVEPSSEVWTGKMTVKDGKVNISFFGNSSISGVKFKGKLEGNSISGDFDATVFSGTFTSSK